MTPWLESSLSILYLTMTYGYVFEKRALEFALELESFRLANLQQRPRVSRRTKLQDEVKQQDVTITILHIDKKMEAASDQIARSMEKLEAVMRDRRKPKHYRLILEEKILETRNVGSVERKVIFAITARDFSPSPKRGDRGRRGETKRKRRAE